MAMSILSDIKILEKIYDKSLVIEPFVYSHLQPASIDLTLSNNLQVPVRDCAITINPYDKEKIQSLFKRHTVEDFNLCPGDFVIGQINEKITIPPDCNGHIQNRNSIIRLGIDVGLSSFINPGYSGQLPIVIKNIGNFKIQLTSGMRICQLVIKRVEPMPSHDYSSKSDAKYQNEADITLSKMYQEKEFLEFMKTHEKKFSEINNKDIGDFFTKRILQESKDFFDNLTDIQKTRLGI